MLTENERKLLELVRKKGLVKKDDLGSRVPLATALKDRGFLRKVVFGEDSFVLTEKGSRALKSRK